nr:C40 family peptidase [Vagococcus lutrae]
MGPNSFDCSGLTNYVYRQVTGRDIGGWTVPQEAAGVQIPVSQAQPGDLLFWGARGATYHVAISTGGSGYIHAPTYGQTVTSASISPYFAPSFAVRVL